MKPFIFGVESYPLMVFLGIVFFILLSTARIIKEGDSLLKTLISLIILVWASSVGARLLFHFHFPDVALNVWDYLYPYKRSGFAVYGGLLTGGFLIYLYSKIKDKSFLHLMDALTPGILIGIAIGRIGCFLGGCCHGKVWHGLLAVEFPYGSQPHQWQLINNLVSIIEKPLPVHPTQLYEFAGLLLLALIGMRLEKKGMTFSGSFFFIGIMGYSLLRLINLQFRANPSNDLPALFYPILYMGVVVVSTVRIWMSKRS